VDIFTDLETEDDRLEAILARLDEEAWLSPSGAVGWSVADVVLHLAQTDEAVVSSAGEVADSVWGRNTGSVDDIAEQLVQQERTSPDVVFARWKAARRASLKALQSADPQTRLRWATVPLKPTTLATTRLAEHWAHGLDITEPLGIEFADTDRLRNIAWLGHTTLPYAFSLESLDPQPVYCELIGPSGDTWTFGPADAESSISGSAGEFCRVGARRLKPQDSQLRAEGPHADQALKVLRNYAG
jgi:uncharacterized protein (TIGR03084 family)